MSDHSKNQIEMLVNEFFSLKYKMSGLVIEVFSFIRVARKYVLFNKCLGRKLLL